MSRKNHIMADARLLQTDKRYANLKQKQKDRIAGWMYEETKAYYLLYKKMPENHECDEVAGRIYEHIESAGIWIPYHEVHRHYIKKRTQICRRIKREVSSQFRRIEKVNFMNMCMIQDHDGNVLALDKVDDQYTGTTFPGGHVEEGETFADSVIREVREETGLTISSPVLTGVYHWSELGIRSLVLLYKADTYEGTLKNSEEGMVYWISKEDFLKKELAAGMNAVLKIMDGSNLSECHMTVVNGHPTEALQ